MTDQQRYPQLHPDAPPVPHGLRPRAGVEMGCGRADCTNCYEPLPVPARPPFSVAKAAQDAIDVQSACNLSGVVRSFAEITQGMRASGLDTPTTNTHPISRLFAEQILHLTGGGMGDIDSYTRALDACQRLAKGSGQ